MNLQQYIKKIRSEGKRHFTIDDVLQRFSVSRNYARVALHRLLQSRDLISPLRGLYVIVPPEHQPYGSIPAEELVPILMKYLDAEYYVSILSAAQFYGATHQKPAKFQVISNKRIKRLLSFGEVEIEFIYKKSLLNLPTREFVVSSGYLKVATPELIALDLLNYPNHAGGLNHVATVLAELIESLDPVKLIKLACKIKSEYQLQRIGYILDRIEVMDDEKKDLVVHNLAKFVQENKYHIPLASEISKTGYPRCKKWKIIENTEIESDL